MGIKRQVFLSVFHNKEGKWNLKMTAAYNGIHIPNNAIHIGWGDTIEWLLAPNSGIAEIKNFKGMGWLTHDSGIAENEIGVIHGVNGWISQIPQFPRRGPHQSKHIYEYPDLAVDLILQGESVPRSFTFPPIEVSGRQDLERPYKAQVWNLYINFNGDPSNPVIGISQNPDGPFVDPTSFLTTVYESDMIIWQFASPPYSNGGYFTGLLPPQDYPLFSNINYTEGICAATVFSRQLVTITERYSFSGAAAYSERGVNPYWFTIDPKIRVNPQP